MTFEKLLPLPHFAGKPPLRVFMHALHRAEGDIYVHTYTRAHKQRERERERERPNPGARACTFRRAFSADLMWFAALPIQVTSVHIAYNGAASIILAIEFKIPVVLHWQW